MATKSFLKSVNIRGAKQVANFAKALDKIDRDESQADKLAQSIYEVPRDKIDALVAAYRKDKVQS